MKFHQCPKHGHTMEFVMPDTSDPEFGFYECPSCQPLYRVKESFGPEAGCDLCDEQECSGGMTGICNFHPYGGKA